MLNERTAPWRSTGLILLLAAALVGVGLAAPAQAAAPIVKVVPWVAGQPLVPHDTYPGKTIHLKGTTDATATQYYWDFGDGSAPQGWTNVTDRYVLEATHAYAPSTTFPVGTVFTARLYVKNAGGETAYQNYFVKLQAQALSVEVNVAIDEGLWELHKEQRRWDSGGVQYGAWDTYKYSGAAYQGYYAINPANINAFEVNGHQESGPDSDPYTETAARGMNQIFNYLYSNSITSPRTFPVIGSYIPDGDGNGQAIWVNQSNPFYQGGMFVDAIVASGTPDKVVMTGPSGVSGKTYKGVVQDMVDGYAACAYNGSTSYGGWRYNCGDAPDNSPSQWGAIAIIPAVREWGVTVDPKLYQANKNWLTYSYQKSGSFAGFGYTDPGYYPWGPYATTPSGMVQMVMDGIGRGTPMWDTVETTMRDNFGNGGGPTVAIKGYYYGLFSFVKSMLLSQPPITLLQSSTPGVTPIDWYGAEAANGAPTDGVARTLVNGQNTTSGYWYGHNYDGNQYYFETAWAIIMLNRTLFTAGAPVAVGVATPNPAVAGAPVTLDGTGSYQQDPTKHIVQWDWDVNNDGNFELHGPIVSFSWGLGTYPVTLRVTDDSPSPATALSTFNVLVTIPPIAPTANAGGPYNFCPQSTPWFLDGSKSVNPDEGQHEVGAPGDTIYANPSQFSWNLGVAFGDAVGVKPNVTSFFSGKVGSFLVTLRVTDTTATSFPSSGQPNLSSTSTAQVYVHASTDPQCAGCINDLKSYPKNKLVQLSWSLTGADHYNIYRATTSGGPYTKIGKALGSQTVYLDYAVVNGTTYYYVVRPATIGETELCQSNQVSGKPVALAR